LGAGVITLAMASVTHQPSIMRSGPGRIIAFIQKKLLADDELEDAHIQDLASKVRMLRGVEVEDDEQEQEDRRCIDRPCFAIPMYILTFGYSIAIAVETDMSDKKGQERQLWCIVCQGIFCAATVLEVVLKVAAHGLRWLCSDFWSLLSVGVALSLLLDTALLLPLNVDFGLRLVALLRTLELPRHRRMFQRAWWCTELRSILEGIIASSKAVGWSCMLLLGLIYVFAIPCTKQIGQNVEVYEDYQTLSGGWDYLEHFGTMARSMYTLLQVMTLDMWSSRIVRHVLDKQGYMGFFFVAFVFLAILGVMNVVVAIIIQHMLAQSKKHAKRDAERQQSTVSVELEKMLSIFDDLQDDDDPDTLTLEEFNKGMALPRVRAQMRLLGLPVLEASQLFGAIDGDGSRSLTKKEFVDGCSKLKGPAQSRDLLSVQAQADSMKERLDMLDGQIVESERMLRTLEGVADQICARFQPSLAAVKRRDASAANGLRPTAAPKTPVQGGDNTADASSRASQLAAGNCPRLPAFPDLPQ